jgi:ADP-ribose pyrophosphatase
MASQFKLLSKKTLLTSRVYHVRAETWRGPTGTFTRDTVVHPGAIAVIPFDHKGRVIMIRQFRPAAGDWMLEIPAGTLEKGEQPLACAKRELIEEIGFAARKWKKLGAIFTAPGFCSELIHIYKASDLKAAFAEKDEDEHIEVVSMSLKQLRQAVKNGNICDGKTICALGYLSI